MATLCDAAGAIAAGVPYRAVIDGRLVAAASGETLPVHAPRDGSVVGHIPDCGAVDIDAAVAGAKRAFEAGSWSRQAPRVRKAQLLRLADLVADRAEELATLETIDTGKPIADTRRVDIPPVLGTLRYYAEAIDKLYGEVGPSGEDRLSWAVHEPLGVIGAIVPWNFPLHMAMWKIAPALAMGNSVVVKPSELSWLGELALEAGLPAGVLNIVTGRGHVAGDALARHMDVDMIAFTGSGPTWRALMRASADSNLERVGLELGGKSPHIVLADCPDLDRAATQAAWGIFYNQGQVCTAGLRLLVARDIRHASFDGAEQAVDIANDTPFGLASGVWTALLEQANFFARRLRAGLVWVNGWDACDITMPFGGLKQSGFGRDRSLHALYKYADLKAVSVSLAS